MAKPNTIPKTVTKTVIKRTSTRTQQNLNPFFTLEDTPPSWAQRAKTKVKTPLKRLPVMEPEPPEANLDPMQNISIIASPQSPNLLASQDNPEVGTDTPTTGTARALREEITTLRHIITDMQTWMSTKDTLFQSLKQDVTMNTASLKQTDIHELRDKIGLLKANVVQHDTYDCNRVKVSTETDNERHRIDKRFEVLEASKLTNRIDFHSLHKETEADIVSLKTTMVMQYDALQEQIIAIVPEQNNWQYIQELEDKQEEVTQALNELYTAIKEDLLTETKETLVAELDFEFQQDASIDNELVSLRVQDPRLC
jgi:hypothetical protein